ncbi:uncharacterized protein LOC108670557 [Hyalella azteca]|uniref:Uncharacterized protein LOC108670557 n=1 Tax=Hyalella azteca TaxID=294128 RepID=A0A8B7NIP3_HYAAZ|nr:uncharacterized protein LOC108670557 [Hyalella azteca]
MSEKTIQRHLTSGVLSKTASDFRCNVCQQNLGQQALQHINGTPHKNKVFFQLMVNPSRYPNLFSALPTQLTQALKKGVIRAHSSKVECIPCAKSMTGETPVLEHLKSEKHAKQVAGSLSSPASAVAAPTPYFDSGTALPKAIQQGLKNGSIAISESNGIKTFKCNYCDSSVTGDVPLMQHLNGNPHKNKVKELELRRCAQQQPTSQIMFADHFKSPVIAGIRAAIPSGPVVPAPSHFAGQPSYVHFSASSASVQPSFSFPTNLQGSPSSSRSSYNITCSPRGLVVVFNYTFRRHSNPRLGWEVDERNLKHIFRKLEYKVVCHTDCSKAETIKRFESATVEASAYASFLAFFLSHGSGSSDAFSCGGHDTDDVICIRDLYMHLINSRCRGLASKPKILFFNYCRGTLEQERPMFDSGYSCGQSEAPRDVAIVQAALPEFKAARREEIGTVFVHSLCEVLASEAKTKDLIEIVRLTSLSMQEKGGSTATVQPIDFATFFFA